MVAREQSGGLFSLFCDFRCMHCHQEFGEMTMSEEISDILNSYSRRPTFKDPGTPKIKAHKPLQGSMSNSDLSYIYDPIVPKSTLLSKTSGSWKDRRAEQFVSSRPASRLEVVQLAEIYETWRKQRKSAVALS
eukprot:759937_1